jgi:hypothetical protein
LKSFRNKYLLQKLDTDLGLANISRSIISFINDNVNENSDMNINKETTGINASSISTSPRKKKYKQL